MWRAADIVQYDFENQILIKQPLTKISIFQDMDPTFTYSQKS